MNNELERILGDVADGAAHRAGPLPVEALRGRGMRRRRTRQAGYGVVGAAAAFGLAFGAAQVLPEDAAPGPAAPSTVEWPTADSSLPLGACGSVVTNLPLTDSPVWLELSDHEIVAAVGAASPVAVTVQNFDVAPLDLSRGAGPYLFVARDGVVVGFSWLQSTLPPDIPSEELFDDFSAFLRCEQGELRPSGDPDARAPLPVGTYTVHSAITLRPDSERSDPELPWAFDLLGRDGTLTVTADEPAGGDGTDDEPPGRTEYAAEDVGLPECGEPVTGYAFPAHVTVDPAAPLRVSVRETSRGNQLHLRASAINTTGDGTAVDVDDIAAVVVRDGVVAGHIRNVVVGSGAKSWAQGQDMARELTHIWSDCDTDEESQTPSGDYEVIAMRILILRLPDDNATQVTVGYETVEVSVGESTYDPGAQIDVALPLCGEATTGFAFPLGVHVADRTPLEVTVGHTGVDDAGDETFFGDGYGDQLDVTFPYLNTTDDWSDGREVDAGVVIARDGKVVARMSWPRWHGSAWDTWLRGERRPLHTLGAWADCASGETGQVPRGEYEILGWRTIGFTHADGSTEVRTIGYPAAPFTAYDFEDADNPGS